MLQRAIPPNRRADYQTLIHARRGEWKGDWGTGVKDLPFGCAVSFRGRNWTVGGYDTEGESTTLRLVNRDCSTELALVDPDEVTKATGSKWQP